MENDVLQKTEKLKGIISLEFQQGKTLDEFCEQNFANYSRERFEAIAIRLYYGKETIVTLYALDKGRQETGSANFCKLPVKKFKSTTIPLDKVLPYVSEFNFTLSTGKYPLDEIEVINK